MSNALIDALLPASKSPRPAEPGAPRANERGQDFAPALNKALDARPAQAATSQRDDDEDRRTDGAAVRPAGNGPAGSGSQRKVRVTDAVEANGRASPLADDADESEEDAVEISAEAAAAAAAAAVAAPAATDEASAELPAGVVDVAEVPTAENLAKSGTAGSNVGAAADAGAAWTAESGLSGEPGADAAAGAESTLGDAPNPVKGNADPSVAETAQQPPTSTAETSASTNTASQAADGARQSAAGRRTSRGSNDQPAQDDNGKLGAASKDHASAADASAELDAASESLNRGEAGGDALEVPSNDVNNAVGPQAAESGRSSTHSSTLSRLAAERSLHAPADPAGDNGVVDRGRFVGRVEGAIRAAQQRDGRIQVRLSPPELGALRIELTIQQGALAARLEAETPATRNLLLDNLPALRERLAQQDIRIERFDVDLRQDAHSGGGSQQGAMQERQPREAEWRQNQVRSDRGRSGVAATPTTARNVGAVPTSDLGLDVRV